MSDVRIRAALHEGGHAVVAHALGVDVFSVQVGAHSFCRCDDAGDEQHFLISLAGPLAEELSGFDPPYGEDNDRANRRGFYFRDGGGSLQRHASELVQKHLDVISFVAANLVEEGRLSGRQLDYCIDLWRKRRC